MKISDERQDYLVQTIVNDLLENKRVTTPSRDMLFQKVKIGMNQFIREYDELDKEITHKLKSVKRGILPGSSEWDVLYRQFFEDSYRKKSSLFTKV